MVVSDCSVDAAFVAKAACETKNCPFRFVGGECFHCKNCFQCCNQKLTRCKLCGTRECHDCINYVKAVLENNQDGHRCLVCEAEADPHHGWQQRVFLERMRRTGNVPKSQSELEEWLKDGPSAIDGDKWFSPPIPMTQSELEEWMKECGLKRSQ